MKDFSVYEVQGSSPSVSQRASLTVLSHWRDKERGRVWELIWTPFPGPDVRCPLWTVYVQDRLPLRTVRTSLFMIGHFMHRNMTYLLPTAGKQTGTAHEMRYYSAFNAHYYKADTNWGQGQSKYQYFNNRHDLVGYHLQLQDFIPYGIFINICAVIIVAMVILFGDFVPNGIIFITTCLLLYRFSRHILRIIY